MTEYKKRYLFLLIPILLIGCATRCDRDDVRTFEQALKMYLERPSIAGAQEIVTAFDALKVKSENQHYASTSFAKASWKGHPIDFLREIVDLKKERDQLRTAAQDEQEQHTASYETLKAEYDKLAAELKNEQTINLGLNHRLETLSKKVCIALDEKRFTKLSYETQAMYTTLAGKATPASIEKVDKETLQEELAPALRMLARNETMITDVACAFEPVSKLNRQTTRLEQLVRRIEKQHAKFQGHMRRTKELSKELEQERETRKALEEKLEKQKEERKARVKKTKKVLEEKAVQEAVTLDLEEKDPLHQNPEQTPSVEIDNDNNEE